MLTTWASLLPCGKPSHVYMDSRYQEAMSIFRKNIYRSDVQVILSSCMVISDFYRSFVQSKTILTKYYLTQWISKLPGSFEIHWVRAVPIKFHGSDRHSECICLQDWAIQIVLIFNIVFTWIPDTGKHKTVCCLIASVIMVYEQQEIYWKLHGNPAWQPYHDGNIIYISIVIIFRNWDGADSCNSSFLMQEK